MQFEAWKKAVLKDVGVLGFNPTYRKWGLSSAMLRAMVNAKPEAVNIGFQSWKRWKKLLDGVKRG